MLPNACPIRAPAKRSRGRQQEVSKRDPQSNLFVHRERGFIPEGLLNYLALLGWGIADDHDVFSLDEMVAAFDVVDVNSNPARFDQKKADALNAEHLRLLERGRFHRATGGLLRRPQPRDGTRRRAVRGGGGTRADPNRRARRRVGSAEILERRGIRARREVCGQRTGSRSSAGPGRRTRSRSKTSRSGPPQQIEAVLKVSLLENLALKPRKAFGPIRVAATGATVSPPLFESLELLGRDRSLRRLRAGRDHAAAAAAQA